MSRDRLSQAGRGAAASVAAAAPVVGKHSLVQRKLGGAELQDPGRVRDAAARGTATPAQRLPHGDVIQRAFGRHDISGIQAHTGLDAAATAQQMGARGYATGDHVVLAPGADLHTAAHEAAHVVQQRAGVHLAGGVGAAGDVHERHADEVADLVVQGKSAEAVLDRHAGGGGAPVVQHKLGMGLKAGTRVVRHTDKGDEDHYEIVDFKGTYRVRNTVTSDVLDKVSAHDPAWGTKDNQVASRQAWEVERDLADLATGHNYVSEDYKRINSLLGALQQLGYTPEQVADPELDLSLREDEIVVEWRKVGIQRGMLKKLEEDNWDAIHLRDTLQLFKRMHRVWDKFDTKPIVTGTVCRGDSTHLYDSFGFLDPKHYPKDGEHAISQTIRWPGVMSTTLGHPKDCSVSNGKKIVWKIDVPKNHQGKKLGNNDSEAEATFPVGTAIQITGLLVRTGDKSVRAGEFGESAEVVVFARITSEGPPPKEKPSGPPSSSPGGSSSSREVTMESLGVPLRPSPMSLFGGPPKSGGPKPLPPQQQVQLELLKRQLKQATQRKDEVEIQRLEREIATIEDKPQPKKLSPMAQLQVEMLKKQLKTAQTQKDNVRIEELTQQISKLEGGSPQAKQSASHDDGHGPVLTVGHHLVGKEDGATYLVEQIIPGGAHGAWQIRNEQTNACLLWKPSGAVSVSDGGASVELMAEAEVGATGLANFLVGGYLVPRAQRLTLNGHLGTGQPFIEVKKQTFRPDNLAGKQAAQMVAHMIADWIISNHDNNDTQFLFDIDDNLIGIDKGQAFKHFREGEVESRFVTKAKQEMGKLPPRNEATESNYQKWESDIEPPHLDPGYHPSGNFKVPSPRPFVEKAMSLSKLPFDWNDEALQAAIHNAEALTIEDVERFLGPYARRVFKGKELEFYQAVVGRANRIQGDLQRIFGDKYVKASGEHGHRPYQPKVPPPPKPYQGKERDELGGRRHDQTPPRRLQSTLEGRRDLDTLLEDFGKFDHKGSKQHDGTLRQHSIYVANAVDLMFEAAGNPGKFKERERGDRPEMYGDYVKNIPPELRPLLALTGFLHDAGKGGEQHLHEDDLTLKGSVHHAHPKEGFEMMLPSPQRESVNTVKDINTKRTDFDYHLRQDVHEHATGSSATFDFGQFFDRMNMTSRERAIVQIGTAMHYDFGGIIMKSLGDKPEPAKMRQEFDRFLQKLREITRRTAYGEVDELLVNIVIMIGAADVLGSKQVDMAVDQQSIHAFPQESAKRSSGFAPFHEYHFKDKGRVLRLALLSYFRTGEVQRFALEAPRSEAPSSSGEHGPVPPLRALDAITQIARIDRDGTIQVQVNQQLITAYLQDLISTNHFLSDAEGDVLGHYWHVHADVFTVTRVPQNGIYREPRSGRCFRLSPLRTLADGHCLIHGLRMLLAGSNAPPDVVKLARVAIAARLTREQLTMILTNIISDKIEGNQAPGLRERLLALLDTNLSVILSTVLHNAQAMLAPRKPPSSSSGASKSPDSSKSSSPPSSTGASKSPGSGQSSSQEVGQPGDGELALSAVYGDGEPIRGALLFAGAHYVVLDEIRPDDRATSVQRSLGQGAQNYARLEISLREAGANRDRLANILGAIERNGRNGLREALRTHQLRLPVTSILALQDLLSRTEDFDRPRPDVPHRDHHHFDDDRSGGGGGATGELMIEA